MRLIYIYYALIDTILVFSVLFLLDFLISMFTKFAKPQFWSLVVGFLFILVGCVLIYISPVFAWYCGGWWEFDLSFGFLSFLWIKKCAFFIRFFILFFFIYFGPLRPTVVYWEKLNPFAQLLYKNGLWVLFIASFLSMP